jgi:hypothetical protein
VLETVRRFQIASPASVFPPLSPTRGSGVGAWVDRLLLGEGEFDRLEDVELEQAARSASAVASEEDKGFGYTMQVFLEGGTGVEHCSIDRYYHDRNGWPVSDWPGVGW